MTFRELIESKDRVIVVSLGRPSPKNKDFYKDYLIVFLDKKSKSGFYDAYSWDLEYDANINDQQLKDADSVSTRDAQNFIDYYQEETGKTVKLVNSMNEAVKKAEPTAFEQLNGYMFQYGIKLNIRKLGTNLVTVRTDSIGTSLDKLRDDYIKKINKMNVKDAIEFIENEIDLGYLGDGEDLMISDYEGKIKNGKKVK